MRRKLVEVTFTEGDWGYTCSELNIREMKRLSSAPVHVTPEDEDTLHS